MHGEGKEDNGYEEEHDLRFFCFIVVLFMAVVAPLQVVGSAWLACQPVSQPTESVIRAKRSSCEYFLEKAKQTHGEQVPNTGGGGCMVLPNSWELHLSRASQSSVSQHLCWDIFSLSSPTPVSTLTSSLWSLFS